MVPTPPLVVEQLYNMDCLILAVVIFNMHIKVGGLIKVGA